MSGGNEMYNKAIPINSIGFFGLHIMTAGNYSGEVYEEKTEIGIKKLFVSDGLLSGYILIGNTDRAGIYTSLVRDRVPLDSIDFEMLKKVTTLSIFPQETRRKMLGGVV